MTALWIWGAGLLTYGLFWLWYGGARRPLTPAEVDGHMARLSSASLEAAPGQLETLRAFLASDDGREFFMVNLVRVRSGPVLAPGAAEPRSAREVLEGYTKHFMPALFRRAGHPAFFGRSAGGYVEHWDTEPNPGWSFGAAIRYRSRRDMIELVNDPRFAGAHAFKRAAIENTFAFPATPGFVAVGPRIWVALVLALVAALTQLALRAA
jgi:hypothetical protein